MIDYYTGKINKHENINLIIEDGSYATDDELKNKKKRYGKYIKNSNLWQVIVSFNNPYIDSSIKLEDLKDTYYTVESIKQIKRRKRFLNNEMNNRE
ncbi:MAG: hypothetical protein RRY16_02855 [Bacilli bacterium]